MSGRSEREGAQGLGENLKGKHNSSHNRAFTPWAVLCRRAAEALSHPWWQVHPARVDACCARAHKISPHARSRPMFRVAHTCGDSIAACRPVKGVALPVAEKAGGHAAHKIELFFRPERALHRLAHGRDRAQVHGMHRDTACRGALLQKLCVQIGQHIGPEKRRPHSARQLPRVRTGTRTHSTWPVNSAGKQV